MESFQLSPKGFLAGEQYLTNWALVGLCGVNECMIQISLDRPLLSDQLKAELNPLAITICSVTSMPSTPVPFHVLEETCMPVYCQYNFFNLNKHKTKYEKHGKKIWFRDVNIIFTGLLNPLELHEFLSGPPMTIEIHDRDRKRDDKTPVGFSCGFSGISSGSTSKRKKEDFNYHGVASLNLYKLLLGTTNLKVCLPIKSCTSPLNMDTARDLSVQPGHYINANSELKVRIKLACPLNFSKDGSKKGLFEAVFGRVIYIFDHNNVAVMDKLRQEILRSNADVFGFDSRVLEHTENALSNYTTFYKHSQSPDLDYVTGFHLVDKRTQIVVAEGLRHKAVRRLCESVSMKLSGCKEEQVIVHYNANLAFSKRIYDTLNLSLMPIILPESMEIIMMKPLVYIRSIVPPLFLQGLLRLKQLCQVRSLKDAVQYNLFPSAEMIQSLSTQFKKPTQQWKQVLIMDQSGEQTPVPVQNQPTSQITDTKENSHLDISKQHGISRKPKDFIQENIKEVQEDSARLQKPVNTLRLKAPDDKPAHNYSIQTFNTNELNKQWLERQMAKLPGRRFTYRQEYWSATVKPGEYTLTTATKDRPPEPSEVFTLKEQVLEAPKPAYRYFAPLDFWDISRPKVQLKTPDQLRKASITDILSMCFS
ncbi:uncharacterized protein FLJ43738 [Eucyclogobius newberryi]|uniref:uncharacterized protein FLJ43738 n=1 Tax=Eucyclogobius newberryi TaxID=166745 RepID=UPI003B593650